MLRNGRLKFGCTAVSGYAFLSHIARQVLICGGVMLLTQGCSILATYPDEQSQDNRFAMLPNGSAPVNDKVSIYWDEHAIPFIEAENNADLAFAVGVVHAHLRLGQLELFRYLSQGRLSELAGPIPQVKTIDIGLRTINFCRSGNAALAAMSDESRNWMTQFTAGLNWYISGASKRPAEHRFLDLPMEPYSIEEVMCIARLVSADLSWAVYLKFLKLAEHEGWEQAYQMAIDKRNTDTASYQNPLIDQVDESSISQLIQLFSKSGSNSLVVSGQRTQNTGALIASDPHVGLFLPNFWLLMGIKSPDYHAVGLMIPGVPVIGVGRNHDIAWGGTNMRGISSHLIDVSDLPPEQIEVRTEKLKSRWWFDREISIRETPFGPILTDLDYFDSSEQPNTVALDWLGYRGSDEIGAFLKVARARNWDEYRLAYEHYAISAMNMLYADRLGNIGMIPAYRQPVLRDQTKTLDLVKTSTNTLVGYIKPIDQPNPYNPDAGYIASANNKPFSNPVIPYGYGFANNDRIDRLHTWMDQHPTVSVAELESLQLDVYSRTAYDLAQWLTTAVSSHDFGTQQYILDKIAHWDGRFNWDNIDAVAFEVTMYYAWQDYVDEHAQSPAMQSYLSGYGNWRPTLLAWFRTLPSEQLINYLSDWLANSDGAVEHYPNWGQFHRQGQAPILGSIPVIGKRFALEDYPASGGNDTLFKSGRPFSPDAQSVTYGSSARHISDMSSPDENYFVLHGGQDGWYGSPNLADQTALWRAGEYIRIPLTMENVKRQFNRHVTRLHAGHAEQE